MRAASQIKIVRIILPQIRPATLTNKFFEGFLVIFTGWENFVMIPTNTSNKAFIRLKCQEIAIELVRLIYKIL